LKRLERRLEVWLGLAIGVLIDTGGEALELVPTFVEAQQLGS
jgi:hypothetical protein